MEQGWVRRHRGWDGWLQHNPLQCANYGVLCMLSCKTVWMYSPLDARLGDKEPREWEWGGAGVGASSQCPSGTRRAPSPQAGSMPSMPSSLGSGF